MTLASRWADPLVSRLRPYTTTIFAEMSALATSTGSINLGQGFPDTDGPASLLESARQAIADGVNQYPPGPGIPALRQAIADARLRDHGQDFDPDGEVLVTDAEALQEILHRYVSIHRHDAIEPAMRTILDIVEEVVSIERGDVERARDIVLGARLSARDAIHIAVMRRRGITRIMTFDRGFDQVPGIVRIG